MINYKDIKILAMLTYRDIIVLKNQIFAMLLDSISWPIRTLIIFGFILVSAGLPKNFAVFYFVGLISSVSIIRINHGLSMLIYDEITNYINYEVTLPISSSLVLFRKGFMLALKTLILSLSFVPFGLVLLSDKIKYFDISFIKLILVLICSNFMVGFATLWISSWIKGMIEIGPVWVRYTHTLWLFGCFFFSWKLLYSMYPTLAIINLFNPLTTVMEGMRSAMLGPENYLNFWFCLAVIIAYTLFFAYRAFVLLKRRLDII